jgi:AraC-like DNA-binding protein
MRIMKDWDLPRSIMGAQILVELGVEHGLSIADCLAHTGIEPTLLTDAQAIIAARQELTLVRNLKRAIAVPDLGLLAGQRYHLTTMGVYGLTLTSSANLRSAFEVGIRYIRLSYVFCGIRVDEIGEAFRVTFDDQQTPEDVCQFLIERLVAGMLNFHRELLGIPAPMQRIAFRWPAPADISRYIELFGIAPEFDADSNYFEMPATWANTPLPQANVAIEQSCEAQCRELLAQRRALKGLAAQVRELLLQETTTLPDMEHVAAALSMTSRTLRRKLGAEGTRFRALLDEVREALADELLSNRGQRVDDVAQRLGYADSSSFIYAYKRWTGRTPRGIRRSA